MDGCETEPVGVREPPRDPAAGVLLASPTTAEAQDVAGTSGANRLTGTAGSELIFGHEGDDVLWGRAEDDRLLGGPGDELLKAEPAMTRTSLDAAGT